MGDNHCGLLDSFPSSHPTPPRPLTIFVTMVAEIGGFLLFIEICFQLLNQVPAWS